MEASVEPARSWKLLPLGAAVRKRPRPLASGDERYPEETLVAFSSVLSFFLHTVQGRT